MRNYFLVLVGVFVGFTVSGCTAVDSALQIKEDALSTVDEIQENIAAVRENIDEKRRLIDEKLEQIEAAEKAISELLGTSHSANLSSDITGGTDTLARLHEEVEALEKEVEILETTELKRLEDMASFSIE